MTYKGFIIDIEQDDCPLNPRTEWYNASTMVCWHRRYILGDPHHWRNSESFLNELWLDHGTEEDFRAMVLLHIKGMPLSYAKEYFEDGSSYEDIVNDESLFEHPSKMYPDSVHMLPLYLYDHSGITMNTGGFSCPWDSGQVGYIYMTQETADKEGIKDPEEFMRNEVAIYSQYLEGDVWWWAIYRESDVDKEEIVESCGGFFGYEYAEQEAKGVIDDIVTHETKEYGVQTELPL